ncbi:MAG: hypothetical protein IT485_01825 [Gammaproteobacteria bacterium]|nr:hypothetical protein [Gammaproteobacteria bacterium]
MLQQVKAGLEHGEFQNWIEANCAFSYATAAVYLKAALQNSRGLEFSSLNQIVSTGRPKTERLARVVTASIAEQQSLPRNVPRAERVSQIRELSNEGHTPAQIAQKIGVSANRGELSRELEISKGGANPKATLPIGGKSKAAVLKAAGLSTSAAHRAERLA